MFCDASGPSDVNNSCMVMSNQMKDKRLRLMSKDILSIRLYDSEKKRDVLKMPLFYIL